MAITKRQMTLVENLQALITKKNLSQSTLANIIQCSKGTMSDLLGSKREFSDAFLARCEQRVVVYGDNKEEDLVTEVRQFKQPYNIIQKCHKEASFALIVGNSGIGKTIVGKYYAKHNPSAYYIKVDRKLSYNALLSLIALELGLLENKGKSKEIRRYSSAKLLDMIVYFVETQATIPCIIIDEAEVLSISTLQQLKNLYTATEGLLSIIISGITSVKKSIAQKAGYNEEWFPIRENNRYTTFARRLKPFVLPQINLDDMRIFCKHYGITNEEIVRMAFAKWGDYGIAYEKILLAQKDYKIDLNKITKEQFNQLLYV